MIVFSAGMQKSGTAWYFNLTNDLLSKAGYQDTRSLRDRFGLNDFLLHHNCNIGELCGSKLKHLEALHNAGFTFAVKTHSGLTEKLKELIKKGVAKITYIYRIQETWHSQPLIMEKSFAIKAEMTHLPNCIVSKTLYYLQKIY